MFNMFVIPRNRGSKNGSQQQVLRGPMKSAERPTIGPRPLTVHIVRLFVK